jgi:hypothetical protein
VNSRNQLPFPTFQLFNLVLERGTIILVQAAIPAQEADRVQVQIVGPVRVEVQELAAIPVVAPVAVQQPGVVLVAVMEAVAVRGTANIKPTSLSDTML